MDHFNTSRKPLKFYKMYKNNKNFIYKIDNIFTKEECKEFINMYNDSSNNIKDIDYPGRQYTRLLFKDKNLAKRLHEVIKPCLINEDLLNQSSGVNDHIRLSKYKLIQSFEKHKDGFNRDGNNSESYATLNIFLNDEFNGGRTLFFNHMDSNAY